MLPLKIYKVAERSMEPKIRPGDYLLIWTRRKEGVKPGDVIVLRHPVKNISLVKRVDTNDDEGVYVTSDNRFGTEDSRSFGKVPHENIVGRVIWKL